MNDQIDIEVTDTLAEVPAAEWNALNDDGNPFLNYEFLHTLHTTGCLGDATGWYPRYFLLWENGNSDNQKSLLGAVPAYIKTNSYGEFVFDWAWADAYQRHQLPYYPKLVSAIPFTPATGRRILVRNDQPFNETAKLLAMALRHFADEQELSGVHYLFVTNEESRLLCENSSKASDADEDAYQPTGLELATSHLSRVDCQYHWHNKDYLDFDDFLAKCTAKRRKTIRRERRHVTDAGLRLERRLGNTLSSLEWRWVHEFYQSTYDRKWGNPSLTASFFEQMGQMMGEQALIVFAYDDEDENPEQPVACSIMFIGQHTLYGRFWGCRHQYHSLHFEACYYQGIEFCIEHAIRYFEPGAQGEHKITRGFVPTITRSAHYIRHPGFREAIANYLNQEHLHVEQRCAGLHDLLPFKADPMMVVN